MDKTIFSRPEYKRYENAWNKRVKELTYRAAYYDGTVYTKKMDDLLWGLGPKIRKEIKPLFLPFSRAVDIDAGIIGGDWAFPEDDPKAETWDAARDILFDMSNWDVQGVLFVHYGSMYGVVGLRVADVREKNNPRVIVTPCDPTRFMLIYEGMYSSVPSMALWIENREDETGKEYEYSEVITPKEIMTFKDGEPFGYDDRQDVYTNEQGIIPMVECVHINDGTPLGECTYQKAIPLLNEVNEMATKLSTIIHHNAEPQAVISGADPTDLKRGGDVMWYLPPDATANFIVPTVDIPGVLEFIREIKTNVHDSLPELSFDEIRKNGQVATATLEIQLQELVIKIKRVRPNYDRCLTTAMQMAGAAAATMRLTELVPLNDEELILDPMRPVLPQNPMDKISLRMREIELEQMEKGETQQEGQFGR